MARYALTGTTDEPVDVFFTAGFDNRLSKAIAKSDLVSVVTSGTIAEGLEQ